MTSQSPEPLFPSVERTGVLAPDPSMSPAGAEHLQRMLLALTQLRAPSLAPLVRVSPLDEGVGLTHLVPADAVALADLRGAPLRAGHVLTVALAVVDALVELAAAGLAHGGVSSRNVLVAPDGSVLLAATGLAWRRPPGDVEGPRGTDDVAAVGDLVRDLLGRASAPSPLVLAALRASDGDPALRPAPAELRAQLERCGRPAPLRELLVAGPRPDAPASWIGPRPGPDDAVLTAKPVDGDVSAEPRRDLPVSRPRGSAAPPRPAPRGSRGARAGRRLPTGRPALLVVSALALVALGALRVGARAAAEGPEPSAQVPVATQSGALPSAAGDPGLVLGLDRGAPSPVPDWPAVLAAVDAGRLRALTRGSVTALRDWVDPAGPAWAADAVLAARVSALHARIDGGALVTLEVRPQTVGPTRSVLLVRDRREGYSVVTATGTSCVPVRADRWWRVTLVRVAAYGSTGTEGWRIHDVAPVAAPTG